MTALPSFGLFLRVRRVRRQGRGARGSRCAFLKPRDGRHCIDPAEQVRAPAAGISAPKSKYYPVCLPRTPHRYESLMLLSLVTRSFIYDDRAKI
jgi:hypothetical protein